jgi:cardiolipin hydrolase
MPDMKPQKVDQILTATLADGRLSRTEREALRQVIEDWNPSREDLARLRSQVFDAARDQLASQDSKASLTWAEEVLKVILPMEAEAPSRDLAEAHFSPGEACRDRIEQLLNECTKSADICVFTITDNRLARAIDAAHRRGVSVRVVSDDQKSEDRGSDIHELAGAGVPVRTDHSHAHMHHKFAVFDGGILLTGSYNWTRSAFTENQENILVTGDRRLVDKYSAAFDAYWTGPNTAPYGDR